MKIKTDFKKLYNHFSVAFIVISIVLAAHIVKLAFTAGFLYFYFGHLTNFTNYNGQ